MSMELKLDAETSHLLKTACKITNDIPSELVKSLIFVYFFKLKGFDSSMVENYFNNHRGLTK